MGGMDRLPYTGARAFGLILALLTFGASCTTRSAFQPVLTPLSGNDACFGTSDFKTLPAVFGSLAVPEGANAAVGGEIALPKSVPAYATRFTAGLATSSIGHGHQAFVIEFHSSSEDSPLGTIIYADRALCTLTPRAPDETMQVGGHPVYIVTTSLDPRGDFAIHGIVVLNRMYVDIDLAWTGDQSRDTRIEYLSDWISRIVS